MDREAIINVTQNRLVEMEGKILTGECKNCGRCCYKVDGSPCEYLLIDSYMDDAHTIPIYSCKLQFSKPISCVLYPLPEEEQENCGFHWITK